MIIDSHYHADERILSTRDLLKKAANETIDKIALIAPMNDPFPEPSPFLMPILRATLRISPLRPLGAAMLTNFTKEGNLRTPNGEIFIYKDPDNEKVFTITRSHPETFLGFAFVNPNGSNNPLSEFRRWENEPGFIGLKGHPFWHQYAPVELAPAAAELAKTGKPLLIHCGFGPHGDFESLIREVPDLKLILAHAGFPCYRQTWKKIRDNRNIYVDLSQTSYVNRDLTRKAVEYLGADRCIFGTDGPYGPADRDGLFSMGTIKRRIEDIFPDKGVQKRLLGENFAQLCGLK